MKNLVLLIAMIVSITFIGCDSKKDVCCEFSNGCATQKSDEECKRLGGTPKSGSCKAIVEDNTVAYKCQ